MEFFSKIICPLLLLASICFSVYQRNSYASAERENAFKIDRTGLDNFRLTKRVETLTSRAGSLAEKSAEREKELSAVRAELEARERELATAFAEKNALRARVSEIEKQLSATVARLDSADAALAKICEENKKLADEPKKFELTQDVYLKRSRAAVLRRDRVRKTALGARKKSPRISPDVLCATRQRRRAIRVSRADVSRLIIQISIKPRNFNRP